jgi:hypothetical protein
MCWKFLVPGRMQARLGRTLLDEETSSLLKFDRTEPKIAQRSADAILDGAEIGT